MPPSAKFTKKEIIDAAVKITKESGINSVTARAIGAKLNSSARPIFTVFDSMDEVLCETVNAIRNIYNSYITYGLSSEIPFRGVGTAYVSFAKNEPNFFRLLFMKPNDKSAEFSTILTAIDENSEKILNSIMLTYGLDKESAYELYKYLWIFTHGIATLIATNVCNFTDEEIGNLLSNEFIGILKNIKSKKEN